MSLSSVAPTGAREPRRIAVLAVHGVGDHPPSDSARSVCDLLAGVKESAAKPKYSVFRESLLRLKVRRTIVHDHTSYLKPRKKFIWGPMQAIAETASPLSGHDGDSVDHLFMESQLSQFDGDKDADTYQFLRLDGERLSGDRRKVRVYEMYWADLSRLGTGFTSIFTELYQLLFHLTSIGINNLGAAAVPLRGDDGLKGALRRWTCLHWLYISASAIFAWPIAILNLFLAAFVPAIIGISLLHAYAPRTAGLAVVLGLYAVSLGTAAGAWLLQFRRRLNLPAFATAFLAPPAAAGAVWWQLRDFVDQEQIEFLLAALIIAAVAVPVWLSLHAYERRRPGSLRAAIVLAGACVIAAVWWRSRLTFLRASSFQALLACVNGMEIVFQLVFGAWVAFGALYVLTLFMGAVATALSPAAERPRAIRTFWTALIALVLPSLLFLVFTIAGWTGVFKVVIPLLPVDPPVGCHSYSSPARLDVCYEPMFAPPFTRRFAAGRKPLRDWADWQINEAAMASLPALLPALLAALILAVWSFGPSVWDEIKPGLVFHQDAGAFGKWLSCGFRFLYPAGWILIAAMTFCLVAPRDSDAHRWLETHTLTTKLIGTLVAGAGAGLLGFRGRLSELALGFRPVVRVMLDVDSWLREHPRDSNPTARICARYVSLLRHICNYRDEQGRLHDALVIVAHSQGTVITTDLLRFLRVEYRATKHGEEYDPALKRLLNGELPVYLFTMGCPLRQLYGLRFPYLYGWAHHERAAGAAKAIPDNTKPDPAELGVRYWTNAFRSGDYIGRHLWRTDEYPATASPEPSMDTGQRRGEACIGAGAHTHYWDDTAPAIARILDEMVNTA